MANGRPDDLPYLVEQWDDGDRYVEELIALTGDYRVARAAFAEAAKQRPGRIVTLRQKTRLLGDSRRKHCPLKASYKELPKQPPLRRWLLPPPRLLW